MTRNDVFVQRGIRAVKLWQMAVSVCLHIDTCVIYIGDVKTIGHCLILAGIKGCLAGIKGCQVQK